MKLVYQGPETDTPGDLRVYEREDGSIEEVRSRRHTYVLYTSQDAYDLDSPWWESTAKKLVTREISERGDTPYGDYELMTSDHGEHAIYNTASNKNLADAVRIEVRQKYWPAVEGEES